MQHTSWVIDGEQPKPKKVMPNDAGREQLPYLEAFEVTEKTPKAQMVTIEGWNTMRQRLLDTGEMKSK